MDVITKFSEWFSYIYTTLNKFSFANAKLGILLVSFLLISIFISVFWRGGRG